MFNVFDKMIMQLIIYHLLPFIMALYLALFSSIIAFSNDLLYFPPLYSSIMQINIKNNSPADQTIT